MKHRFVVVFVIHIGDVTLVIVWIQRGPSHPWRGAIL